MLTQIRKYKVPEIAIDFPNEEWKQIPSHPAPIYWFSNLGRIKRDLILKSGKHQCIIKKPINTGNSIVAELAFGIVRHRATVARFILLAFNPIENHTEYRAVNLNNDYSDNRLDNLKWMSKEEFKEWRKEHPIQRKQFNQTKQYRNRRGFLKTRASAFTNADHTEMVRLRKLGYTEKYIASQIANGCTQAYVSKVLNGKIKTIIQ
ncbi:MAG TPA: hypothetical protein VIH86_13855 [Puia sp.]